MKSTEKKELSYFRLKLETYLNEHFPEMLGNNPFITARSDEALTAYCDAVAQGFSHLMERIRIESTSRVDVGDIIRHESGQTSVTIFGRQDTRLLSNGNSLQLTFRTFKRRNANERKQNIVCTC